MISPFWSPWNPCGTRLALHLSGKVQAWLTGKCWSGSSQCQGPRRMLEVFTVFPEQKLADTFPQSKAPALLPLPKHSMSLRLRERPCWRWPWEKLAAPASRWLHLPQRLLHISSFQAPVPDLGQAFINSCPGFWSRLSIGYLCLQCFFLQSSFCPAA